MNIAHDVNLTTGKAYANLTGSSKYGGTDIGTSTYYVTSIEFRYKKSTDGTFTYTGKAQGG